MNKNISFSPELIKQIQNYANRNTDGNFTFAVKQLCKMAKDELEVRKVKND